MKKPKVYDTGLTKDEMIEALVPHFLEDSFPDGGSEEIVRDGFMGLNERTGKAIRELYLELVVDPGDDTKEKREE